MACGGGSKGPGANVVACFDLDGNRTWTYHEAFGAQEHGTHTSPFLQDGRLVFAAFDTLVAELQTALARSGVPTRPQSVEAQFLKEIPPEVEWVDVHLERREKAIAFGIGAPDGLFAQGQVLA